VENYCYYVLPTPGNGSVRKSLLDDVAAVETAANTFQNRHKTMIKRIFAFKRK
jgi:hypothetical protein